MPSANCFDAPTLKDYLLGKLSDEQSDVVAAHLEACLNCEATVSQLDRASDTLTSGLRLPAVSAEPQTDDDLQKALNKVQSMEALANHPPSEVSADRSPVLRDYRLLEPLGFGGMGTVYKAVHTRLDRLVAVKLLPARRLGDEQAVARFQREMRVIGQLSHPAIVQATDAGEVDGTHFLVMEYVEGCDLNTLAKACGSLSVADACEITRQAALGLEYAHQQGIVHRDIKPSNLMLSVGSSPLSVASGPVNNGPRTTDNGPTIKILDLGLALLSGEQAPVDELTTVGQLMGTLDYMAPEQLEDSHLVGPRADIYALAATLYRLLTGFAPFAKDDRKTPLQKLRALATQAAPPIRDRRADIPEALAALIDRALLRDPNERFASMAEFAAALAPWCAGHDLAALAQRIGRLAQPVTDQGCSLPGSLSPWERAGVREPSASRRDRANQLSGNESFVKEQRRSSDRIPHPSSLPEGEGTGRRTPRLRLFTTLAILFLAALGIVITIETNKGTLIVESLRDGVEVRVKKSGKTVEQLELTTGPKSARLAAGEYEIEILGDTDGLQIQNGKFVLKRGDTVVAKVTEAPPSAAEVAAAMDAMTAPGIVKRGPNPSGISESADGAANAPPIEPDDEKPNPTAKSIDQGLASHPDHAVETKYREALRIRVDLKFADTSIEDGLQYLQEFASVPIWLDKAALEEEGIATDTPVTLKLDGVSLSTALRFTLRPLNLTSFWDGTSIRVTTLARAKEQLVSRSYPVGRSLPMVRKAVRLRQEQSNKALKAFLDAGGDLKQLPSGGGGGGGGGFFDVPTPRSDDRHSESRVGPAALRRAGPPDSAANPDGGPALEASLSHPTISFDRRLHFQFGGGGFGGNANVGGIVGGDDPTPNQLAAGYFGKLFALLTDASWMTADGEGGTLQLLGDVLVIRQTRPVHEQIEAVLRVLEQASTGPLPKSPVEIRRPDYPFEADQTLREKLSKPVEFVGQDTPLTDALQFLEDFTQTRILVDTAKLYEEAIASDTLINASLKDMPFQAALHRLLDPLQLVANVEEGLLVVTTKSASQERLVLKGYETRDLFERGVDEQELLSGLESGTVGPWLNRHGEGGGLMVFADRLLFVKQTQQNHAEVEAFLRDLRSQLSEQPRKKPLAQTKPQPTPKPSTPVATNNPEATRPTTPTQPANDPKQPRYDGKTFDEWLAILDTERSPARLADAIEALRLLGRDTHADKIAESVLKLARVMDFVSLGDNNNRPSIHTETIKLFADLPDQVAQRAYANELRNGTTRSRVFVLQYMSSWQKLVSDQYVLAVLATCRDSDPQVRELSVTLLERLPLEGNLARYADSRTQQFRTALTGAESRSVLLAAKHLLDSEPDSKAVAGALARIVAKPGSSEQRMESLNLIAVMGPRAVSVASQVAAILLEPSDGKEIQLNFSDVFGSGVGADSWLGPFRSDRKSTWQFVAAVALARMGNVAAAELPKIDELTRGPIKGYEDQEIWSLEEHVPWQALLRAARTRIETPPTFDLRHGELIAINKALQFVTWNHKLLQMEQALLQQYRGKDHPSVQELTLRVQNMRKAYGYLLTMHNMFQRAEKTVRQLKLPAGAETGRTLAGYWVSNYLTVPNLTVPNSFPTETLPELWSDVPLGLTIHSNSLRVTVILEVGKLGAAARDALPVLKKELESKDKSVAAAAEKAIKQIEAAKDDQKTD